MSFAAAAVVAVAGAAVSAGTSIYSANKASSDAKKARDQQAKAANGLNFGEKPDAALYQPVDFNDEQTQAIRQNWENLDFAQDLTKATNFNVSKNDLARATRLIPHYNELMRLQGQNASSLLRGQLPYNDVLDVVSNRAGLTNATGIPGTGTNATLRDLGMSQLGAIQAGQGIMQSMVQTAGQISPLNRYMTPQDQFISPRDRISNAMQQNQLIQQSQQSANNLEAGISPTETVQNQLALRSNMTPTPSPDYSGAIGSLATSALGAYGQYRGATAGAANTQTGLQPNGYYNTEAAALQAYGSPGYTAPVKKYYSGYSLGA